MEDQHKNWAMQWKAATPRLQAVRDEELRRMGGDVPASGRREQHPEKNGLVIFQRWMMRKALLDAMTGCD
jgi:hypothetical protein